MLAERQAARLDAIVLWAELIGALRDLWLPQEQRIHLRPSGTGVRVVDLHPSRPQLDRGKLACLATAKEDFLRLVTMARSDAPNRTTPEKRLQSWLLREAYAADRQLLQLASNMTFVTDEQRYPVGETKDVVCDLLAVRLSVRGVAPVVLELKSERQKSRLIEQVQQIAAVVDAHPERFGRLFSTILGRAVVLEQPCERWIVWPAVPGSPNDPRATELAQLGIQLVSYTEVGSGFSFAVGPAVGAGDSGGVEQREIWVGAAR